MTVETEPDIDTLRAEIDRLDAAILAAVRERTEVSRAIGRARMASGGTRLVHSREMKVIERYSALGDGGKEPPGSIPYGVSDVPFVMYVNLDAEALHGA